MGYNGLTGLKERFMAGKNHVSLTEAKQRLGELVKRAAYGGERFVLEFRERPEAALVSYDDLRRLEMMGTTPDREGQALEALRSLRERITARTEEKFDSVTDINRVRQDRTDELSNMR
jgi:prevent-host-death family protein